MNYRIILFSVLFSFFRASCFASVGIESTLDRISVELQVRDGVWVGAVDMGDFNGTIESIVPVEIRNPFTQSATLKTIRRSCGCINFNTSSAVVEPSQSILGFIKLGKGDSKQLLQSISLDYTASNEKATIQLLVTGHYRRPVEVDPSTAMLLATSTKANFRQYSFVVCNYFYGLEPPSIALDSASHVANVTQIPLVNLGATKLTAKWKVVVDVPEQEFQTETLSRSRFSCRPLIIQQDTQRTLSFSESPVLEMYVGKKLRVRPSILVLDSGIKKQVMDIGRSDFRDPVDMTDLYLQCYSLDDPAGQRLPSKTIRLSKSFVSLELDFSAWRDVLKKGKSKVRIVSPQIDYSQEIEVVYEN
ncbi:MAG: hypothetical protein NTY42_18800 [Planctomycetota bacterium]|nr:hypothetical protein [Planctomycetota bacterium]